MYIVRFFEIPAGRLQSVCVKNAANPEIARRKVKERYHVHAFVQIRKFVMEDL